MSKYIPPSAGSEIDGLSRKFTGPEIANGPDRILLGIRLRFVQLKAIRFRYLRCVYWPARNRKGRGLTFSWNVVALIALISFACNSSDGRELISFTEDLGILRDFSNIIISGAEVKSARVFIDIDRFVVPRLPSAENAKLQQIAVSGLGSQLHLVSTKEQANYLIQIRMEQYNNYAIRNPRGQPSRGFVMISLCRFPLNTSNCENLQYDYFKPSTPADIFSRVLGLWLKATVKADQ